jgi:hypothetical protein
MFRIDFIGGEKGGVGKSVVARLLAQYHIDKNIPFLAMDADSSHNTLLRFYSEYGQPVRLNEFESADQIVQQALDLDKRVLVDLPSQSKKFLDSWLNENGVLDIAAECQLPVYFWHVMDDGIDSLNLLNEVLTKNYQPAKYVIVKNLGCGEDFSLFENSPAKLIAEHRGASVLELHELHRSTMRKIDRLNFSYWAAANNKDATGPGACLNVMERQRVKVWLRNVYAEFDKVCA